MESDKKDPTTAQQIAYIMENHQILDHQTKTQILNIVWLEAENPADVFGADDTTGVDIDLDACAEKYLDVIRPIYNLVRARRLALSQPAREKTDGGLSVDLHAVGPSQASAPENKTGGTSVPKAAETISRALDGVPKKPANGGHRQK